MRNVRRSVVPIAGLLLFWSLVLLGCQGTGGQVAPATPPAAKAPPSSAPAPTTASAPKSSGQVVVVKVSNDTAPQSLKGQTWERFKQLAESKLKGKVQVQIYHSGSLYKQDEQVAALQQGNVQFISPGSGVYTGLVPSLAVYELPYTYKSYQMMIDASNDPAIGGKIAKDMEAKGITPVATWLNGYRIVGTTKSPITKLEDLKGLKIRTPPGKIYTDTFKALGANVVPVNWQEIHTALQQGIVDAIEPTANNWWVEKLNEQAPNITYTDHILSAYVVATNTKWWNGLSPDIRQGLKEAMDEATKWNLESTKKDNEDAVAKMKQDKAKFYNLSPEEFDRWRNAVKPVINSYRNVIGSSVLDELDKMSTKYQWEKNGV